jgi:hypothetical protein
LICTAEIAENAEKKKNGFTKHYLRALRVLRGSNFLPKLDMPRVDFFNFFRYVLAVIVTVYATVITLQSLYGWYVYLSGSDKYMTLIRRYVIVQGLRLRFRAFWGDVIICILLSVVCLLIFKAHTVLAQTDQVINNDAFRVTQSR